MNIHRLKEIVMRIMADQGYDNMSDMSIKLGLNKSSIYNAIAGRGTGEKVINTLKERFPSYFEYAELHIPDMDANEPIIIYKKDLERYKMTDQKLFTITFLCEMLDMDIKYLLENKESIRKVLYKLSDMKMRIMKVEEILLN